MATGISRRRASASSSPAKVARHHVGAMLAQALQFDEMLGLALVAARKVCVLEQLALELVQRQVERGGQGLPGQRVDRFEDVAHARWQRGVRKRARRTVGVRCWSDGR
ncbi:hypothetical protein H1235_14140 [Pseudoxanthomonas sp. NC8]|nr:hypothetical protein H1235_14140 [Pseudoxanthomonas sp. NC8]